MNFRFYLALPLAWIVKILCDLVDWIAGDKE